MDKNTNITTDRKKLTAILIISGLAIFILGGIAGALYQNQISALNSSAAALPEGLKSKAVSSIIFFGKVEKVFGRMLKISSGSDSGQVSVLVSEDAKISMMDFSGKALAQKPAGFKDIKIGDSVNVTAKIMDNYAISGVSLVIFPAQK